MARPFSRRRHARSFNPNRVSNADALTASAARVNRAVADSIRRVSQVWQTRAFIYYDIVPEVKYAAQFYSRALALLRLYVGQRQDDGTVEEAPTGTPEVVLDTLNRVQDPGGGGREGMQSAYGRLMFLVGETILFASHDDEDDDEFNRSDDEQWEMLSTDELRIEGDGKTYRRLRAPSLEAELYTAIPDDAYEVVSDEEAMAFRLWRRHPRFSFLADSSMQAVLDICEELVLLTQAVRARAKSRLASAGILLVNGRYLDIPAEDEPDEDGDIDPFVRDLMEAMLAPMQNEGAASAVVPHVVRVDVDKDEGGLDAVMRHIQIVDPMQTYPETGLRYELIKRLAIGLDMPPEILLGMQDSNHWTAWQVDEQTWKAHLQPIANQLVADLNSAFFHPTLRRAKVDDFKQWVITYDATAIINHPDRSDDAIKAYDRRAIGKPALRLALGFTEDDAPTEEELYEMLGVAVRDGSLALFGIPSIRSGGIEPTPGDIVDSSGNQAAPDGAKPPGGTAAETEPAAPEEPVSGEVVGSAGLIADALVYRIIGASEMAYLRARELAGARLRNSVKRAGGLDHLVQGVPPSRICAAIGLQKAVEIKAPNPRALVEGATEILRQTLREWQVTDGVADALGERLEQFAARTLFDERPPPLPPEFANYVAGLVRAQANGNRTHG